MCITSTVLVSEARGSPCGCVLSLAKQLKTGESQMITTDIVSLSNISIKKHIFILNTLLHSTSLYITYVIYITYRHSLLSQVEQLLLETTIV